MFDAVLIEKTEESQRVMLSSVDKSSLPEGDVLVDVVYSTLNYKDALAITGAAPVVRQFPMVPGIDFAGTVAESDHPDFKPGDDVILNGWGVGEKHWGGLGAKARVRGDWLVPLPDGLTHRRAMALGTAGYTAMLCVLALETHGITPDMGPVVVSGAAGGVGSVATALLAGRGFEVDAVTGRSSEAVYLKSLGAATIVDRADLTGKVRPLAKERWAAGVDVAGSTVLANMLSGIRYGGAVAACGLAAGMDLPTSVAPFILRGVSLLGVDSVMVPKARRMDAWACLAREMNMDKLDALTTEIPLAKVIETAPKFLEGQIRGRLVVPVS